MGFERRFPWILICATGDDVMRNLNFFRIEFWTAIAGIAVLSPIGSLAQPACHEPATSEFRLIKLVDVHMGLEEDPAGSYGPVQMAIAPDGRVFVGKMKTGEIRVYAPTAANPSPVTLVGTIPTWFSTEDGLLGIALDPKFAVNHWMYAFYSDPCGKSCANRAMELGRFTITDNKLTNKKIILRFPRATDDDHHAAGGLAFADNGMLVIGTGDNTDPHDGTNAGFGPINTARPAADAQRTSSNTNDLRGKILRIKPIPFEDAQTPAAGVGSTYEIPAGNLWESIDKKPFNPGWDATDNIGLVRKEIYAFGNRNPYHVRTDSRTGWVFWGEVGPDAGADDATRGPSGHDEWNLATAPGFFGHPYCNGYNVPYNKMTAASPAAYGAKYDCAATVNNSPNNTGIHHLPPALPALAAYTSGNSSDDDPRFNSGSNFATIQHGGETAIGGPMYRYDPNLTSAVKFPPFFEGKVLFFDWSRQNFRFITLNPDGTIPAGAAGVRNFAVTGLPSGSYIDQQYGPDGAMYLLKFSEGGYSIGAGPQLFRVEYTGVQDAACYKPFTATVGPAVAARPVLRRSVAPVSGSGFLTLPAGYRSIAVCDVSGRQIWGFHRDEAGRSIDVRLPAKLAQGVWRTRMTP
ncbi:MAG: glucose dehydrogenase [Fibrobacteres bacterium]|nr:glucose dehydrogenase [Fibrobacterota bacterium]